MTQEAAAKKDTQKLQRAIVDGLEDVKAQDIQVFNTEHLSPLFERVIVASGTSNRQTKALASSVIDAVREAGFPKPRIEGEEVGEWIIVDCGAAVAHIMQPAIRQYYHLEEIWGEKPVKLRLGAPQPAAPAKKATATGTRPEREPSLRRSSAVQQAAREAKRAADADRKGPARTASAKTAAARVAAAEFDAGHTGRAAKAAVKKATSRALDDGATAARLAPAAEPTPRTAPRKAPAKTAARAAPAKTPVKTTPAKSAARSTAAARTPAKTAAKTAGQSAGSASAKTATKTTTKTATKTAAKTATKTAASAPAKSAASRSSSAGKTAASRSSSAGKTAAKKAPAKTSSAKTRS